MNPQKFISLGRRNIMFHKFFSAFFICFFSVFLIFSTDPAHSSTGTTNKKDSLARSQKTLMTALKAQNTKTRVAAENMANSNSADYVPKTVYVGSKHNRKDDTTYVNVKNIQRDQKKVKKVFDPNHPKSDANGMVSMPDTDPLMNYMDLQKAKLDTQHIQKSYQLTTEMRHQTIKMIGQ